MSNYRRNVLVGATVLASLVMLGWMIIRFGGDIGKLFAGEMINIRFKADRADGLSNGSAIVIDGVTVGRVTGVRRDPKNRAVWVEGTVEVEPPLPNNLTAFIRQASLLGSGSNIVLEPHEDSTGVLTAGTEIPLRYEGLQLLPPELKNVGSELAALAKQFREANVVNKFNEQLDRAGKTLDAAQLAITHADDILKDGKIRNGVQESIENIRQASVSVRDVSGRADKIVTSFEQSIAKINTTADAATDTVKATKTHIDEIAKSTQDRIEDLARLLAQANDITAKINAGQGTAGKVINDPKLYEGLVDTTNELNATIKDLQRLVRQWEQEGVSLKLR
jgi:phospholipid/cholesterol/gamma-HCH transport system substrate-binding protein